jgi:hypothetical protein
MGIGQSALENYNGVRCAWTVQLAVRLLLRFTVPGLSFHRRRDEIHKKSA